jgi:hypothetical protein
VLKSDFSVVGEKSDREKSDISLAGEMSDRHRADLGWGVVERFAVDGSVVVEALGPAGLSWVAFPVQVGGDLVPEVVVPVFGGRVKDSKRGA